MPGNHSFLYAIPVVPTLSVGANIIAAIVEQFRGSVAFNRLNPGTEVFIRFKRPRYKKTI